MAWPANPSIIWRRRPRRHPDTDLTLNMELYRVLIIHYLFAAYRLPACDLIGSAISFAAFDLYAWPIQQLVWVRGQSGYTNAAFAALIVVPVACLSWRKKQALSMRRLFDKKSALPRLIIKSSPTGAATTSVPRAR
jgi:hypothetical protein